MYRQQNSSLLLASLHRLTISCFFVYCLFVSAASSGAIQEDKWLEEKISTAEKNSIKHPSLAIDYLLDLLRNNGGKLTDLQHSKLQIELARNYLFNGQLSEAQALEQQISEHLDELDVTTQIHYWMIKSDINMYLGSAELALANLNKAKELVEPLNDSVLLADVYSDLGDFYLNNHDEVNAIDYFYKAYALVRSSGNRLKLAYLDGSIARTYEALFDYEKAIELQEKALKYFLENDLKFDTMVSYYYLAKTYLDVGRAGDANELANRILTINDKLNTPSFDYYAYILLTQGYLALDNLVKAEHFLSLSASWLSEIEDIKSIIRYQLIQAQIEIEKGELDLALRTFDSVEEKIKTIPVQNSITFRLQLIELKSRHAILTEQYQQAVAFQQAYINLNKQYFNKVRELSRSRYKVQFELKKTELENQLLEKDKELKDARLTEFEQQEVLQKTIMVSVLLLSVVFLLFAWRQYRLKRKFSVLANTDYLTGVANRRKIMDLAELQWQELSKTDSRFSLISFDLDHFKRINDEYGHPVGDLVLKRVVILAQQAIRNIDCLGRIGGEEFLVVLNNTNQTEATEIAYRIKSAIEKETIDCENGQTAKVTVSLGVTQKSSQTDTFKDLLKQADKALYSAKTKGRNRVEVYE
ncbi:hypothetical protein C7Y70_05930 [Pseudoalteromonas sp. KS88]|uniref:tetratricopeptide repeat-containing diguanylate cyclase n=1 Tax=Pseudoalteromonas sp. KS88 TaxID=2109918 RepID=UPI001081A274|nr:tetratricopeptide repeat-containing diguanylate cyclase [Pseudoalteromonas sp. KS88]TGE84377.1 hypothetical protein C7Y70_05930 [Pseudoalteromonas sp. KS88]